MSIKVLFGKSWVEKTLLNWQRTLTSIFHSACRAVCENLQDSSCLIKTIIK